MNRQSIGIRIANVREEMRMTQTDLAHRSGISQSHISRLESGNRGVRIATLRQIAWALNVEMPRLLGSEDGRGASSAS